MRSTSSPTLSPAQSEFSAGRLSAIEPSVDDSLRPADVKHDLFPNKRPSRRGRASRAVARFLITLCIGVAATLALQSYGDTARQMVANWYPQLSWLRPQAASVAQGAPNMITPAAPSPDLDQLKTISLALAVVQKSVDQLAVQFATGQEQTTRDITKLQEVEQDILHRISAPPQPTTAPARKPLPLTLQPSQAQPIR